MLFQLLTFLTRNRPTQRIFYTYITIQYTHLPTPRHTLLTHIRTTNTPHPHPHYYFLIHTHTTTSSPTLGHTLTPTPHPDTTTRLIHTHTPLPLSPTHACCTYNILRIRAGAAGFYGGPPSQRRNRIIRSVPVHLHTQPYSQPTQPHRTHTLPPPSTHTHTVLHPPPPTHKQPHTSHTSTTPHFPHINNPTHKQPHTTHTLPARGMGIEGRWCTVREPSVGDYACAFAC